MSRAPFVIRRGVDGVVGTVYSLSLVTKAMVDLAEDILALRRGALVGRAWKSFNTEIYDLQFREKRMLTGKVS